MKKFSFAVLLIALLGALSANAQEAATDKTKTVNSVDQSKSANSQDNQKNAERQARKKEWQDKYSNASPEQKSRMDARHKMMESLTSQQKDAFKAEKERHRQEMKKITGFDPESLTKDQKELAEKEKERHRQEVKKITGQSIE